MQEATLIGLISHLNALLRIPLGKGILERRTFACIAQGILPVIFPDGNIESLRQDR